MISECSTPGCSTLTFGETCLGCEQKKAGIRRIFPRGRPFDRAAALTKPPAAANGASAATTVTRPM